MTALTRNFGLEYLLPGEPVYTTRAVMQRNAEQIDAALTRGGVAPPAAQDLTALAARVTALEQRVTARATVPQPIASTVAAAVPMTFGSATGMAGGWSAANPSRLVVPVTAEFDLFAVASWGANGAGTRGHAYRINGGGWQYVETRPPSNATYGSETTVAVPGIALTAGQYVEVGVWQDSGSSLSLGVNAGGASRAGLRRVS